MNQRGLGTLLIMTSLAVLFSGLATGYLYFSQIQNRRVLSRLDGREGFYASELAAWYRAENQIAGNSNYAGKDGTGAGVPLTLDYTQGTRSLAGTSYNGSSYNDGDPINVVTTDGFLPTHSFIRRNTGSDVYYYAPTAGSAYCGEMKFTKDASSVCLTNSSFAQIAPVCSAATTSWFTGPVPDCTSYPDDPQVAAQYRTLAALPPQPIATVADYNNMTLSNQSYYLKNDLDFGGTCPTKNLNKVLFDGRGHNIKCSGGLFNEINSSVVENFTLTAGLAVGVEGNSCVNHVGLNASFFGETGQLSQAHLVIANSWLNGNGPANLGEGGGIISTVWPGATVNLARVTMCGNISSAKCSIFGGVLRYGGFIGGINYACGSQTTTVNIDQSFITGTIGPGAALVAGGLVGSSPSGSVMCGSPLQLGSNGTLSITRSGAFGTIKGTTGLPGGLVGAGANINIDHSFFKGTIEPTVCGPSWPASGAGGLVGESSGPLHINQSFAIAPPGSPLVQNSLSNQVSQAGGLVGFMNTQAANTIKDSFTVGDIQVNNSSTGIFVRGLVGRASTPCTGGCSITNSFYAGTVTPATAPSDFENMVGGITPKGTNCQNDGTGGFKSIPMTSTPLTGANNFWNVSIEPWPTTPPSFMTSLTTPQMQGSSSNYSGFDFTNTWQWNPGSYPTLQWYPSP